MKMSALLLIAIVIVLTGQYLNTRLKNRVFSLKQFILFIEGINSQMIFSQRNIIQIINELILSEKKSLKTIDALIKTQSGNFSDNWQKAIEENARYDSFNDDDKKILLSFGKSLGVTDSEGQQKNCLLHIELLKKQLACAEDKIKDKIKINTAISGFFAAAFFIIFY